MSWEKVKLKNVLKQYRNTHLVQNNIEYRQVTISQSGEVFCRGTKLGFEIGRKRQFTIDLNKHPNTLIFIRQGVYKGGIGICPKEVDGCIVTENMPMFDIVKINPYYLLNYLKSPQFKKDVDRLVPLGTAQKAIHERQLLEIEIPLPPKNEQKKIVKKLKVIINNKNKLDKINNSNEDYIKKLKQSVLQEAVQGKLVPQDPKDEYASVLLEKIKKEKERLIKEKKIRKEKSLPEISKDEIPYELPKGWIWCRLKDVCEYIQRGKSPNYSNIEKTPVISQKCVQWKGLKINKARFIWPNSLSKYKKIRILQDKDLLWNSTGDGTIGRICLYNKKLNPFKFAVVDSHVTILRSFKNYILPEYILIWISSKFVQDNLKVSGSTKQTELGTETIKNQIIPLSTLTEQKRIIEKVDKLMVFCDRLQEQVKEKQENSEKLMKAILIEAFKN